MVSQVTQIRHTKKGKTRKSQLKFLEIKYTIINILNIFTAKIKDVLQDFQAPEHKWSMGWGIGDLPRGRLSGGA